MRTYYRMTGLSRNLDSGEGTSVVKRTGRQTACLGRDRGGPAKQSTTLGAGPTGELGPGNGDQVL